jgi:hypothetical protein
MQKIMVYKTAQGVWCCSTMIAGVPTFLSNSTFNFQTSVGTVSDAPSQLSLTSLNPGTSYSIAIQAKNALNVSFGAASSPNVFTTTLPTAPACAPSTGLTLTNQASLVCPTTPGGFTLDGVAAKHPFSGTTNVTQLSIL